MVLQRPTMCDGVVYIEYTRKLLATGIDIVHSLNEQAVTIFPIGRVAISRGLVYTCIIDSNIEFTTYQCFWYAYWLRYFMHADTRNTYSGNVINILGWKLSSNCIRYGNVNIRPYLPFIVCNGSVGIAGQTRLHSTLYGFYNLIALSVVFSPLMNEIIY